MDTVQEIRDGIEALEGGLRTRLGRYQGLCLEILGARATRKREWLDDALAELTGVLIEDTSSLQQAMSRVTPDEVPGPWPQASADTLLDTARQAKEAYAETRIHELNREVADMDAQRAAAVKESTELRDALSTWQKRIQELEAVRESLVSDRDQWRTEAEGLRSDLGRLRADYEERLRAVELHGAKPIGGVLNAAPAATIDKAGAALGEALRQASDAYAVEHADRMAAQSIAEAEVAPEPDQNHTETIPAPKKNRLSEEARQRASERMKAMLARKAAEKQAAREAAAVPEPVEAVVTVIEAPVSSPGVFDERTQACRAEIQALYAAGRHFTRDVEQDMMERFLLNRHEVTAIREGVTRERTQRGTRLVKCTECHTEFTVEKHSTQRLCADCLAVAAEVAAETQGDAA